MYVFFPWKHFDVRFWQKMMQVCGFTVHNYMPKILGNAQTTLPLNQTVENRGVKFPRISCSEIWQCPSKKEERNLTVNRIQACHARWQLAKQHITHAEVPVEIAFASHINQMLPYSVYLRSHLPCWSALEKGTQGGLVRVLAALSTWFA